MKKFLIGALALLLSGQAFAVAAPANVSVSTYNASNYTAGLYWDNDATVDQWFIYLDGTLTYSPLRSQTGLTAGARVAFGMNGITPDRLPVTITVKAQSPGSPLSAASTGVWLGTNTEFPVTYVLPPPGTTFSMSISTTASSAPISVSVVASTSFLPVSFSAYSATSYTVGITTINLTTLAGASVPCVICISSDGGAAAGFKVAFNNSATPPGIMSSLGKGHYVAATTTSQCWGAPYAPGTHAHLVGVAATSSLIVQVDKQQ